MCTCEGCCNFENLAVCLVVAFECQENTSAWGVRQCNLLRASRQDREDAQAWLFIWSGPGLPAELRLAEQESCSVLDCCFCC